MKIPGTVTAVGDVLPDGFERRERQLLALEERGDSADTETDYRH